MMARRHHTFRREEYDMVAISGAGYHNGIQRNLEALAARDLILVRASRSELPSNAVSIFLSANLGQ